MRKLIYQFFCSEPPVPLPDWAASSVFSMHRYAERIGADHHLQRELAVVSHYPNMTVQECYFYEALGPFYLDWCRDYDMVCIVDCDVLPTPNAADIFERFAGIPHLGLSTSTAGPFRVSRARLQGLHVMVEQYLTRNGIPQETWPTEGGMLKIYNSGVILAPQSTFAEMRAIDIGQLFAEEYPCDTGGRKKRVTPKPPLGGFDQAAINAHVVRNHCPVTEMGSEWNWSLHHCPWRGRENAQFLHYSDSAAQKYDARRWHGFPDVGRIEAAAGMAACRVRLHMHDWEAGLRHGLRAWRAGTKRPA